MNITILRFDSLPSTNTEAINQAKRGANEGLCVVARQQTAGRGRHGRVWTSPENAGLYFSIVLRPSLEMQFLPLLTLMCAVSVFETLKRLFDLNPDIKWANDVIVNDKKICGILAETVDTKMGLAVIVGIGINLNSANFPVELVEIATSVEAETDKAVDIEELLNQLTEQLVKYYQIIGKENGATNIRKEWTARSSFAFGKNVSVVLQNETITGKTCGIEQNGALLIEKKDGEIITVYAGEVTRLRKSALH